MTSATRKAPSHYIVHGFPHAALVGEGPSCALSGIRHNSKMNSSRQYFDGGVSLSSRNETRLNSCQDGIATRGIGLSDLPPHGDRGGERGEAYPADHHDDHDFQRHHGGSSNGISDLHRGTHSRLRFQLVARFSVNVELVASSGVSLCTAQYIGGPGMSAKSTDHLGRRPTKWSRTFSPASFGSSGANARRPNSQRSSSAIRARSSATWKVLANGQVSRWPPSSPKSYAVIRCATFA